VTYIRDLLEEVWRGNPVAADELADFIEHVLAQPEASVAIAFCLQDERLSDAGERHVRDGLIRSLQNFLEDDLSLRERAEAIRLKRRSYTPNTEDQTTSGERRILWELTKRHEPHLSERQIRRILGGK
jgi:hypothetical protein